MKRSEYEIDCPLLPARAKQLLAYCDLAVKSGKAGSVLNALTKIGTGQLATPALTRLEAPELAMFLEEATAQGKCTDVRHGLAKQAVGGDLTIKLQTPKPGE